MELKNINLTNKCGSCNWFEPIEGTCNGYCLRNKYGENVVCDPNHPYWQVPRSRMKCKDYNMNPPTNADRIRAMTDEELAKHNVHEYYEYTVDYDYDDNPFGEYTPCYRTTDGAIFWDEESAVEYELAWLKQPAEV